MLPIQLILQSFSLNTFCSLVTELAADLQTLSMSLRLRANIETLSHKLQKGKLHVSSYSSTSNVRAVSNSTV